MNGQVYVWKGNNQSYQLEEILPGVHNGSIFTITMLADGFISGGKDGVLRTWDANFSPIETIPLKQLVNNSDKFGHFYTDGKFYVY